MLMRCSKTHTKFDTIFASGWERRGGPQIRCFVSFILLLFNQLTEEQSLLPGAPREQNSCSAITQS